MKLKNKNRLIINIIAVFLVVLTIRLYIDNNVFEVSKLIISDEEIPKSFDETIILHISDLHNKSYGTNNEILVNKIDEIKPDYIFLTGDMVSSRDTDFSIFYQFASKIGKKYKCYYILGNHELDLKNEERKNIYETLENYQITVLDNESIVLDKNGEQINLYGMWYNPKYYIREDFTKEKMIEIMEESEEGFNILLTHNPDDFEVYADWGADLIFSGHVHGGMIRLPFVGGVISPNRTLFPKYDAGIYEHQDSELVVSRGLSRGQTGIRLFNQPELLVIELNADE